VVRNCDALVLRFAFMDQSVGKRACLRFPEKLATGTLQYLPGLREYFKTNRRHMPASGRLALQNGIEAYEGNLRWTGVAIRTYRNLKGGIS